MYKVVIIDDEPIIVTGLTKLVPWQKYDCEVVATAADGQEGLELIRQVLPDIVFSDIYMPRMDGLLMTAALKSEFEDMELTILTGYRDFELVQQALRLGVTRFILKPSNMDELEEALKAMTDKLKKKGIYADGSKGSSGLSDTRGLSDAKAQELADKQHGEQRKAETQEPSGEREEAPSQAGSFIVNNAVAFIRKNYNHKITLKEVADNTYVSQWHLSKLLNRHTGQSFSELLNTIRVEAAKELLRDPALRVGDVADEVGFLDLAHFSRVFKKITGMSAHEYRNQIK